MKSSSSPTQTMQHAQIYISKYLSIVTFTSLQIIENKLSHAAMKFFSEYVKRVYFLQKIEHGIVQMLLSELPTVNGDEAACKCVL